MKKTTNMMLFEADAQSGTSLHFERCKGGYFSNKDEYGLKVVGKTYQASTPALDAPVDIQCLRQGSKIKCFGKNFIVYPYYETTKTKNGIKFTANNDGSILANGTATADTRFYLENAGYTFPHISDDKLYLTGCPNGGSNSTYMLVGYTNKNDSFFDYGNGVYCNRSWDNPSYNAQILIRKGTVCNNLLFKPMLAKSADETYEKYISNEITTPCDLYEGDIWYPASGKVERNSYVQIIDSEALSKLKINAYNSYTEISNFIRYIPRGYLEYVKIGKCNYYPAIYVDSSTVKLGVFVYDKILRCTKGQCTTKDIFQAWIDAGNPFKIVYPLIEPVIEQYDAQPIWAPSGTANVIQIPIEQSAELSATMLTRR